jgi:hypothetical protein
MGNATRSALLGVVLLACAAPCRADEAEDKAVKLIEASGGTVTRDPTKSGKPVIVVSLGPKAGEAEVRAAAGCKSLLALTANGGAINDDTAKAIGARKTLTILFLMEAKNLTDNGVAEFATLKNLKQLAITNTTGVTGLGIKQLNGLPNLVEFAFSGAKVTDEELVAATGFKKVTKLTVLGTRPEITDAGLKELSGGAGLTSLMVSAGPEVSDAGYKELASLKNLTSLTVIRADYITDAALKEFAALKKLTTLSVEADQKVTDAGLKELALLTSLTSLTIASKQVTGEGLKDLAGLKNLGQLYLNCPKFTDDGLKAVAAFKNLTHFQLFNGAGVSADGIKQLASLPKLTTLDLSFSGLNDAGLKELAAVKRLTALTVRGTAVSDAGLKEFQNAVPKCQIVK